MIAQIQKAEAYEISFEISYDHKYLILSDSQALYAANIESLDEEIQFKVIFKLTENVTYVSTRVFSGQGHPCRKISLVLRFSHF